jgi:hypothetical protein
VPRARHGEHGGPGVVSTVVGALPGTFRHSPPTVAPIALLGLFALLRCARLASAVSAGPRRGRTVCTTLSAGKLRLLRRESREKPVPFEAVLARDPEGATVLHREPYRLLVGRRRIHDVDFHYSDCVPLLAVDSSVERRNVRVQVTARARGRGITPFYVEGKIRLAAVRVSEPVQPPDRRVWRAAMVGRVGFLRENCRGSSSCTSSPAACRGGRAIPEEVLVVVLRGSHRRARTRATR